MVKRFEWLGVLGLVSGCAVADLPPLDGRDGDDGADVPSDVPDGGGEPPPWSCEPAAPFALQWGTAKEEEASALVFAGERLWVGGYEEGGSQNDPLPHGDSRGFVLALGSVPSGEVVVSGGGVVSDPHESIGQVSRLVVDLPGVSDAIEGLVEKDGAVFVLGRTRGAFPGWSNQGHFDGFLGRLDGGELRDVVQFGDVAPQHPRQVVALGEDWLIGGFDDIDVDGNYVRKWTDPIRAVVGGGLDKVDFLRTTTLVDDLGGPVLSLPDGSGYFFGTFSDYPPMRGSFVTRYDRGGAPGGGEGGGMGGMRSSGSGPSRRWSSRMSRRYGGRTGSSLRPGRPIRRCRLGRRVARTATWRGSIPRAARSCRWSSSGPRATTG